MWNFTITIALTKTFPSELNDSSLILVTRFYVTNDKIYTQKTFADSSKNNDLKEKEKKEEKKGLQIFWRYTQKVHTEIYYVHHIILQSASEIYFVSF